MNLHTVLLVAFLILLVTGGGRRTARRLGIKPGTAAAVTVLMLFASPFTIPLAGFGSLHPASAGLYLAAIFSIFRMKRDRALMILSAAFCGLIAFFLVRASGTSEEPGLWMALPCVPLCFVLFPKAREKMCLVTLTPLCFALWYAVEEACLFEQVYLALGSPEQLDGVAAAAAAIALLPEIRLGIWGILGKIKHFRTEV